MTAPEIVQEIEGAGGVLVLNGDRIRYKVPEDALALVDVLREHRDAVLEVLRERRTPSEMLDRKVKYSQVSDWLSARCVCREDVRTWAAEWFLWRDFEAWCWQKNRAAGSREAFCAALNEVFTRNGDGWRGVVLVVDWDAACYWRRRQRVKQRGMQVTQ